jgi:hypothetical protein
LHYQYTDTAQRRTFYYEQLGHLWGNQLRKNSARYRFCSGIFSLLQNDERASLRKTIAGLKRLFKIQNDKPYHKHNPVTTVYQLVKITTERM